MPEHVAIQPGRLYPQPDYSIQIDKETALANPLPLRNRSRRVMKNLNQKQRGAPSSGWQAFDVPHRRRAAPDLPPVEAGSQVMRIFLIGSLCMTSFP